ncbi:MAG: CoA-binding protein [Campylobacteraceae bacterium 4484_4]|nr:MAG: CoA-binding protein [Campylobacteraceae bacterium 4484_4]
MECEFPTVNADPKQMREIFETVKTIVIPGLSPNPEKDSHRVAKYLQEQGYKIIPIYPKGETILGEKVYRSLSEIEERIDMVDMFRKPAIADQIVDEIAKREDVKVLWLQKGIVNNAAAKRAEEMGLIVVQNRCSMVEHRALGL